MKKLLLGLSFSLLSSTAFAADAVVEEVVVDAAPGYSWTGVYFGVGGGYADYSTDADATFFDPFTGDSNSVSGDLSDGAGFGTLEIGADYQMQNFVLGAFANYDKSFSASDRQSSSSGDFVDVEVEWDESVTLGARLGYLVNERTLAYGLAGYSRMNILASSDSAEDEEPDVLSASNRQDGWVAGLGLEYLLSDRFSVKTEYRYARYSGFDASDDCHGVCDGGDFQGLSVDDTSVHTIRALVSFRFGIN